MRPGRFALVLTGIMLVALASCAKRGGGGGSDSLSNPNPTELEGFGGERHRLVTQPDEIVTVLENGMTVIARRVPSPVVSVRGYVRTGGVYEGEYLGAGVSHLLEHLVAGGSTLNRTEAENRDLLQQIGNVSNAYTTTDHTAYFVDTTAEHLEQAVDLVLEWLLRATFTSEEFVREYEVVQREMEQNLGNPRWVFYYLAQANRYHVSPAGVPVIGLQEVLRRLTRENVWSYYSRTYQPNNIIIAIAGDVEPQRMLQAVQQQVDNAPPGIVFSPTIPDEPDVLSPRTVVATFPRLGQPRLQIAFPSVKLHHPDLYALDLLTVALGHGQSAILVQEMRDRRGLVSAISASNPTPTYVDGTLSFDMELAPDRIADATEALLEILNQVSRDGIGEERLSTAKTQLRALHVKMQQTSAEIAGTMALDYMSTGDPHFTERYLERIERVSVEQVRDVARRYLATEKMLTTALIPAEHVSAEGLPGAVELLRRAAPTAPAEVAPTTDVTRIDLADGTVLLHKRIGTSPLVVMQMFALGGLTAEDDDTNGLGNLTMEMLQRGTTTRSASDIAEFFDSIGGDLTTNTGNNTWFWTATCLKEDFDRAFDVYMDVVKNPAFPEEEVSAVRQRILAQIDGIDADWHSSAMRFFREQYFGPRTSPYRFMTIGTRPNVERFTSDDMRRWYQDRVLRAPRVLAIYGDVTRERATELAEAHFGKAELTDSAAHPPGPEVLPEAQRIEQQSVNIARIEVQQTEHPLAGIVIGFDAESVLGDPANYAIAVADTMASGYGYPTGYLHEILRGRGLVYVVHAINWPGASDELPGTFLVYAGCDPARVNEVVEIIVENIARLQGTEADMQEGWFERSRQLIVTSEALTQETPAQQAMAAALDELYGLGHDYHRLMPERIDQVTLDQVRAVSSERFAECVVTISTPRPDLVTIEPGARRFERFSPVELTPRGVQHDAPR